MKKLHATIAFVLLAVSVFCTPLMSQSTASLPDIVEAAKVSLKPTGSSGDAFTLAESPSKLMSVFGTPVSTSNAFSELDKTTINRYDFKGLEVYFEGSRLFSLKIKDDATSLILDGKATIKAGDHISSLGTLFPKSYAARKDGQMLVGLKLLNGNASETSVGFWYDEAGVITAIVI